MLYIGKRICGWSGREAVAQNDGAQQRTDPVALFGEVPGKAEEQGLLGLYLLAANRIAIEILDQTRAEFRMLGESCRQFDMVGKAHPVEIARGVDHGIVFAGAITSDAIKGFESKADRVGHLVAAPTVSIGGMDRESVSCGAQFFVLIVIEEREFDVGWCRRHGLAEQGLSDELTA